MAVEGGGIAGGAGGAGLPDVLRSQLPVANRAFGAGQRGLLASAGLALEHRRLFVLLPFGMICGLLAFLLPQRDPHPLALAGTAVALLFAGWMLRKSNAGLRCTGLLLAFWAGFCLLPVHSALFGTQMLRGSVYGTFEARVDEVISRTEGEMRIIVSKIVPGDPETRPVPVRRARLFIRNPPKLLPGDLIRAPVRFYQVPGPVLPGAFDAQFHGYFDGIGAYAAATGPVEIQDAEPESGLARTVDGVRSGIADRVDRVLSQPAAGIARAIINGDQSAVSDEAREIMSSAGLAHVLSISGLHLTLVAGGVFAALRFGLALLGGKLHRLSVKSLAAIGGIVAATLYYAISGGNVAALRSTIMIVLVFGAVLAGRHAITMRNVAIAALLVLLVDPASVFRPSFQLSFAAVVGLVGAFELGAGEPRPTAGLLGRTWRYFWGLSATSLVAGAATVLFSAYHFQQTSPLGVLGNLVSLPLVGFITMPAALLAVLAMPFGLEAPFLSLMGWSIDRMLDLAGLVAALSSFVDSHPLLTPLALCIALLALGWFAFFRDRWRLLGPALAVPSVFLFALDRPPDVLVADTTQAVALRTQQGLALVTGQPDSFAVEVWAETYAAEIVKSSTVHCDSLACRDQAAAGFSVAVVEDVAGFAEDCTSSALVITRGFAPTWCTESSIVIDAGDLRRHGVHWIAWDGRGFDVRQAISDPDRAWRVSLR